jgi:F-type H+-transporting ATPase subunit gamma
MLTLKEYRAKLNVLRNTRKMTKTMRMISVNKLHRAQGAREKASAFEQRLAGILGRLAAPAGFGGSSLASARAAVRRTHVLVLSSDRGLCAGFNSNLCRAVVQWAAARRSEGIEVSLSFAGKRGFLFLKSRGLAGRLYEGATARPGPAEGRAIAADLKAAFLSGECGEVYVAWNRFRTLLTQAPSIERLLPVSIPETEGGAIPVGADDLLEPDRAVVLGVVLDRFVDMKVLSALLDSSVGEHAARMMAMENATRNADELIEKFTLLKNRARQAAITRELMEIISGAEALAKTA